LAWVYELSAAGIRKDPAGESKTGSDGVRQRVTVPSIAVLPFHDMSEKGDQSYFCNGLAEEIINALDKIPNLRVASRMAAFQFGGKEADIGEVGRRLKVSTVLEGSVRKSGDHLRIAVQLVKTSDGYHLWSRQFDRQMKDIFEIQHEIAEATAKAFSLSLSREKVPSQEDVDPRAYDFFLRGLGYFGKHTQQDNLYARQMFRQAIGIDPDFGRAWAGLAYTYGWEYLYFNAADMSLDEAAHSSRRALELSPDLTEAHVSVAMERCMRKEWAAAEAAFEKAIELDPKNYEAWYLYGRAKVHEGDLKRALKLFQRASQVRPCDYQSVLLQAQLYISLGQEKKAIEVTREGIDRVRAALELNPDDNRALNMGAFALERLGEQEEANQWMLASVRNAPMDSIIQYNAACFYSLAGEVERALDCLENCLFKVGSISRDWLENDSDMDNIRDHPRFEKILKRFLD
jgi:adenylate cyclase